MAARRALDANDSTQKLVPLLSSVAPRSGITWPVVPKRRRVLRTRLGGRRAPRPVSAGPSLRSRFLLGVLLWMAVKSEMRSPNRLPKASASASSSASSGPESPIHQNGRARPSCPVASRRTVYSNLGFRAGHHDLRLLPHRILWPCPRRLLYLLLLLSSRPSGEPPQGLVCPSRPGRAARPSALSALQFKASRIPARLAVERPSRPPPPWPCESVAPGGAMPVQQCEPPPCPRRIAAICRPLQKLPLRRRGNSLAM